MSSVKEQVKDILEGLPENVTFEDVHYHLFVREKIERGLQDIEEGKVVTEEEMEHTFRRWLEE
jgi:predicted transcriptional regulator